MEELKENPRPFLVFYKPYGEYDEKSNEIKSEVCHLHANKFKTLNVDENTVQYVTYMGNYSDSDSIWMEITIIKV